MLPDLSALCIVEGFPFLGIDYHATVQNQIAKNRLEAYKTALEDKSLYEREVDNELQQRPRKRERDVNDESQQQIPYRILEEFGVIERKIKELGLVDIDLSHMVPFKSTSDRHFPTNKFMIWILETLQKELVASMVFIPEISQNTVPIYYSLTLRDPYTNVPTMSYLNETSLLKQNNDNKLLVCVDHRTTTWDTTIEFTQWARKRMSRSDFNKVFKKSISAKRTVIPPGIVEYLEDEYQTHLMWLKMVRIPSAPADPPDIALLDIDDLRNIPEILKTMLFKYPEPEISEKMNSAIADVNDQQTILDIGDIETEYKREIEIINNTEARSLKMDKNLISTRLASVRSGKVVSRNTQTMELVSTWKQLAAEESGPLYNFTNKSRDPSDMEVEHVIAQRMMMATKALCAFTGVQDDPLMCFVTSSGALASRKDGAKAPNQAKGGLEIELQPFSRAGTFSIINYEEFTRDQRAFVSRVIIYAVLTYPALSVEPENIISSMQNFSRNIAFKYEALPNYARQIDVLLEYASLDPAEWEYEHASSCYLACQIVNPLTMSERTRKEVITEGTQLNSLLRARLSGQDLTSLTVLQHFRI